MPGKVVIFDTETNGLPRNWKKDGLKEPNNWPDIVSICWKLYIDGRHLWTESYIIKPDGWTISPDSTAIHGISHAHAEQVGRPLNEVLEKFKADIKDCWRLVAHNLNFDSNVVQSAFKWRLGNDPADWWPFEAHFCTMLKSMDELKIPNTNGYGSYKWPKLDELWAATFNEAVPANAHSADRDVEVLQKIYWARYDKIYGWRDWWPIQDCTIM